VTRACHRPLALLLLGAPQSNAGTPAIFIDEFSAPLVAVIVYLIARYETPPSRILALPLAVRLGATSYSIYLLHEILPSTLKRLGLQSPDIAIGWITWAGALILLVLISSASYALIEPPARLRIRTWFATQRLPQGVSREGRV
jgi:peptidoglycan/LPS O-acetylase OafA/YrhL